MDRIEVRVLTAESTAGHWHRSERGRGSLENQAPELFRAISSREDNQGVKRSNASTFGKTVLRITATCPVP